MTVKKWDRIELSFEGPKDGNPFTDVTIDGVFTYKNRQVTAPGFYDGDGVYKLRFMPDMEGEWRYEVRSSAPQLNGQSGTFTCEKNRPENHGPVRVHNRMHFAYEDGTPYYEVGTTCYVWNLQPKALREKTLKTLEGAPFNKMRMCVFPKRYVFNENDPEFYPFVGDVENGFDLTRFDPRGWRVLEESIDALEKLGIEADLILFHPYDRGRWCFDRMDRAADDRYLHYCVARLSAFHNVWWSFANEYDLMRYKTEADWDHYGPYVQALDPVGHLRGIHNCRPFYDHTKPWVTHCSIQHLEMQHVNRWAEEYKKPIVIDECAYEGDIPNQWGSITAEEMTARFWEAFARGGYGGHGETYLNDREEIWWSKGGELIGESIPRIAFFRKILERIPNSYSYTEELGSDSRPTIHVGQEVYLHYSCTRRNAYRNFNLPEGKRYEVEVIDTWGMTTQKLPGVYEGQVQIPMLSKPYTAVLFTQVRYSEQT